MKIFDTVETEEKAKEIIEDYLDACNIRNGSYYDATVRCECGMTHAITWTNGEMFLSVAVCLGCGDDSHFEDEVLYVQTLQK